MKKYLLSMLFIGAVMGMQAQDGSTNENGKIIYEEVVNIEGATKDQLYKQARSWFVDKFKQEAQDDDVIYLSDSYLGELAANPYMWMEVTSIGKNLVAGAVLYDFRIEVKDGRYKYKINNFYHEAQGSRLGSGGALENAEPDCGVINMQQKYWDEIKTITKTNIQTLIQELKDSMATAPSATEGQDW